MTTLASDRNWILDPVRLKLVHQCRRLIHTEFGVKLHLTEENLAQQLADYAQKTRSSHLVRVWNTLKAQVPELAGIETGDQPEATVKQMYRGQPVAGAAPHPRDPDSSTPETTRPRKTQVVYRGQVVG